MTNVIDLEQHVPAEYAGKLEPNYYCRAWNAKREKYCRARAGAGTDHPGVGRCRHHEGRPIVHGMRSQTPIHNERIADLVQQFAAQTPAEKLNIFPELDLARALLYDWVGRFEEYSEALLAWHASYSPSMRPLHPSAIQALEDVLEELEAHIGPVPDRPEVRLEPEAQPHGGWLRRDRKDDEDGELRIHTSVRIARKVLESMQEAPDLKPRQILDIASLQSLIDTISKMIHRWHQAASINSIPRRRFLDILTEFGRAINEEVSDPRELERLKARIRDIRL